jgi:hypothetical protein
MSVCVYSRFSSVPASVLLDQLGSVVRPDRRKVKVVKADRQESPKHVTVNMADAETARNMWWRLTRLTRLTRIRIFQIYTCNRNWEFFYWCYYISLYHNMFRPLRAIIKKIQYIILFLNQLSVAIAGIYSETCIRRNRMGPKIFSTLDKLPHYTK